MELRSLDELSERNTKFILCNSFFCGALSGRVFPTGFRPHRSLEALGATTVLIPPLRSSPPSSHILRKCHSCLEKALQHDLQKARPKEWSALVDDFRTFVASCDLDNRRYPNDNSRVGEIKAKEKKLLRGIDRKL